MTCTTVTWHNLARTLLPSNLPGENPAALVHRVDEVVVFRLVPADEVDARGGERLESLDGRIHRPAVIVVAGDHDGAPARERERASLVQSVSALRSVRSKCPRFQGNPGCPPGSVWCGAWLTGAG